MVGHARPQAYCFDRALIEPAQRRLLVDGAVKPVTPRAFDLLLLLVQRAGELVGKDEIFERVWPGVIVEENNLQVQIHVLRKLIGSAAIETIPGRGYRFRSEVTEVAHAQPSVDAPSGLPRPLTSFVGQEAQLVQCSQLLARSRLVTLTGVGGLGKTRLSLEVASACVGDYADGVWFVDLAPISDARLVSQAVALVVGVAEQAAGRMLDAVERFIRDRRVLLILDNCEHVLRGCAETVAALLHACAQLRVVATSREPLHLQGEAVYPLRALSVPDLATALTPESVGRCDAVRLFVARATAVQPAFRLTEGNLRAVCEICVRLDGIPLALELAAARVRVLSVDEILRHLEDRFRFLKSSDSTAPSRQQTLRATIDWSHDLLSEPERRVLRRLAVFAGGWTFPAAEVVATADGDEAEDVLDLHSHLVDKSLVAIEQEGARYRMLDTVSEYAGARLEASGEADSTRGRHLAYFADLAERAEPHFAGPDENAWYECFNVERQNVLSAYHFAVRTEGRADDALRLAHGCRRWICRGAFDVGRPVLAEALARAMHDNLHKARGLAAAAFLSYYKGAYEDAISCGLHAASLARTLAADAVQADALNSAALGCIGLGDYAGAQVHIAAAQPLARQSGVAVVLFDCMNSAAELNSVNGELDLAEAAYEECLALATQTRQWNHALVSSLNLARIAVTRGDPLRAARLIRSAVDIGGEVGFARNTANFFGFGAGLAVVAGDMEFAARLWGASNRSLADAAQQREPADENALAPCIDRAKAALGERSYSLLEAQGGAMTREAATTAFRQWLATTTPEPGATRQAESTPSRRPPSHWR